MSPADEPVHFESPEALRAWLASNHATSTEIWLGLRKKGSPVAGVTYREALDEALCFGWIDGVKASGDANSFKQRFTPRKRRSIWSAVNIRRVGELTELGRMQPAGLKVFEAREESRSRVYSFEQENVELAPEQIEEFRAHPAAWAFWESRPPYYRRTATWGVISAKREETRARRLATLIDDCANERLIGLMARPAK